MASWYPSLGVSSVLRDGSSNNNHGILNNLDSSDWAIDNGSYCLDFNGSDEYVQPVNDYAFTDEDITLSYSIYIRDTSTAQFPIGRGYGGGYSYCSRIQGGNLFHIFSGNGGFPGNGSRLRWSIPSADTWYHVTVTKQGTSGKLYVNGSLELSQTVAGTLYTAPNTFPFTIGAGYRFTDSDHFDGKMAHITLYTRAINLSEVRQIYRDPHALFRKRVPYFFSGATGDKTVSLAVQSLTLSLPAPTISIVEDKTVTPAVQSLTLSQSAPSISIVENKTVTPAAQSLTLTQPAPTISIVEDKTVSPSAQSLTLTQPAPTISIIENVTVSPGVQALTLSQPAPTINVSGDKTATPAAQILTLSQPALTISIVEDKTVSPSAQSLTLSLPAPTISIVEDKTVSLAVQNLTLTQPAPSIVIGDVVVSPSTQSLTLSLPAPTISIIENKTVSLAALSLTLTPLTVVVSVSTAVESVRKTIIDSFIAELEKILISSGYLTDIGTGNVFEWLFKDIQISELPLIEVKDVSESMVNSGSYSDRTLTIELIGRIATKENTVIRNLKKDMELAIDTAITTGGAFPEEVFSIQFANTENARVEKKNKSAMDVSLVYEVKYRIAI